MSLYCFFTRIFRTRNIFCDVIISYPSRKILIGKLSNTFLTGAGSNDATKDTNRGTYSVPSDSVPSKVIILVGFKICSTISLIQIFK